MHRFDYSFLKKCSVSADILRSVAAIHEMKAKAEMRQADYADVFSAMEAVAKIQSVKSSNAIEGIITTDKRIRDIVNRDSAPLDHNEAEIAGYRDALNLIHNNYSEISFSVKDILELHKILLSKCGDETAGKLKSENNFIMETDKNGKKSIRFSPVPAKETAQAMEQLVLAYCEAHSDYEINPLLLIPCVILDFLCIHPFRDGNGRMSRLLSLMLLYKSGFDAGRYISFEEQIKKFKNYYYTSLQKSSERWHENENNYFPFIDNFLFTLRMSYYELDSRFADLKDKKITKKQRIASFISDSLLPVSKQDICEKLPDISVTTIEAELGKLVKSRQIEKIGKGRGTKYKNAKQ